jgi:hypothetical protein
MKGNVAMRISILVLSAASLVTLGSIAKADDHLFQAVESGGLTEGVSQPFLAHGANSKVPEEAAGRGSPFTSFPENSGELGIPSTNQTTAEHGQELPNQAGPKN